MMAAISSCKSSYVFYGGHVDSADVSVLILYLMTITSLRVLWLCGDVNEIPLMCPINIQTYFEMENVGSMEVLLS